MSESGLDPMTNAGNEVGYHVVNLGDERGDGRPGEEGAIGTIR